MTRVSSLRGLKWLTRVFRNHSLRSYKALYTFESMANTPRFWDLDLHRLQYFTTSR